MPTYQYRCTECGDELEAVQKFTDEPLSVCPVCSGQLRKLFSAVGVVFKGSGFYKTDSRSSKGGSAATAGKKDAAETSGDGSSSSSGDGSSEPSAPAKASDKDSSKGSKSAERATASTGSGASTGDGSKVA